MMAPRRACRYTGKTETAKDMDRSMGVFFLIENCPCEYIYIKYGRNFQRFMQIRYLGLFR